MAIPTIFEIIEALRDFSAELLDVAGYASIGTTVQTPSVTVVVGPDGRIFESTSWSSQTIHFALYLNQETADPAEADEQFLIWVEKLLDRSTGLPAMDLSFLPGVTAPTIGDVWAPAVVAVAGESQLLIGRVHFRLDRSIC